jgi:hypothetical protein
VDVLPPDDLYRDLGRATAAVAAQARLAPVSSQALWTAIGAGLEVEDWGLLGPAGERREAGAAAASRRGGAGGRR